MSYPAYYGRPATVAGYRRHTAPASVHVVALFQYLGGLATLAVAALAGLIAAKTTGNMPIDRIPDTVRRGLAGGSLIIAIALFVIAVLWLVIARKLQTGRGWARGTVLVLSALSIAGTLYDFWLGRDPQILAGLALPLLYVLLLNTHAARSWFRRGLW
jgi:hypothetical protein